MAPLISTLFIAALAFVVSAVTSEIVRRNADRLRLIQTPNHRSSHKTPTPSGGGVGIALASTICGLVLGPGLLLVVMISAAAGLLGFLDDRHDLSARLRLGLHFIFIGVLLTALGVPEISMPLGLLPVWIVAPLLLLGGVWWINLYNFMDGIDGLAASQAVFMCLGAVTLASQGPTVTLFTDIGIWTVAILCASLAFLTANWPPARIFMGDVGSNFLATAIFAVFMILIVQGQIALPVFLMLGALFVTDATTTLFGRIRTGSSGFTAHRLHAYQKLARGSGGHKGTTVIYLAINLLWLYPLSFFAQQHTEIAWWLAALAYLPIVIFCLLARAGLADSTAASGISQNE